MVALLGSSTGQLPTDIFELDNLTVKLNSLLGDSVVLEEITEYLAMGNPSLPIPVLPERMRARNALVLGAVVGVGGAWILLNRRWLAKGMPSSNVDTSEGDEDDEA